MKFAQTSISRPTPSDRHSTSIGTTYNTLAVAPHATTNRFAYTVPAGKKALITNSLAQIIRATAAAPVGTVNAYVRVFTAAAANQFILAVQLITNNVGDAARQNVGQSQTLYTADQLIITTEDLSTGGTINYTIATSADEYDA